MNILRFLALFILVAAPLCHAGETTEAPSPGKSATMVTTAPAADAPPATPAKPAEDAAPKKPGQSLLETKPKMLGPLASMAPVKFGYVDFSKIAQDSKTALKAKAALTKSGEKYKKQLTERGKKLESLKKGLEARAAAMNQLERESEGKKFQAKALEYQEAVQKAEKEMAKQEDATTRKILEQVSKAVKVYGEKNGFTLIVASKELLYSDGEHPLMDVTDEVIRELDKNVK